ncbi:MAG: hypothetical protein KJO69_08780 [Gammaproteobacteria bacterium]|nr:hypothetical protein [Gammaproteobacteria bacterium]
MGFQTGSQIRPELGRLDYSGYTNAAAIQGAAMARLGDDVAQGYEKYQKNKQIISQAVGQIEGAEAANPGLLQMLSTQSPEIEKAVKGMQDGNLSTKSALMISGAISTYGEAQQQNQERQMTQAKLDAVNADKQFKEKFNQSVAVSTDKDGNVNFESVANAYQQLGGQDMAKLFNTLNEIDPASSQKARAKVLEEKGGLTPKESAVAAATGQLPRVAKELTPKQKAAEIYGNHGGKIPPEVLNLQSGEVRVEVEKLQKQLGDKENAARMSQGQEDLQSLEIKELAGWATGGSAKALEDLNTVENVISGLISGGVETGELLDQLPPVLDPIKTLVAPSKVEAIDNVRYVVFQSLKEILGGAFSAKEAENLVSATYNDKTSTADNIRKLTRMANVIRETIKAKNARYQHYKDGKSINQLDESDELINVYRAALKNEMDKDAQENGRVEYIGGVEIGIEQL